jgi:hemoglobin-like flavoprotein
MAFKSKVQDFKIKLSRMVSDISKPSVLGQDWRPGWTIPKPELSQMKIRMIIDSWNVILTSSAPRWISKQIGMNPTKTKSSSELDADGEKLQDASTSILESLSDEKYPSEIRKSSDAELAMYELQQTFIDKCFSEIPECKKLLDNDIITPSYLGRALIHKIEMVISLLDNDQFTRLEREVYTWCLLADEQGFQKSHFAVVMTILLQSLQLCLGQDIFKGECLQAWMHLVSWILNKVEISYKKLAREKKKKELLEKAPKALVNHLSKSKTGKSTNLISYFSRSKDHN